MRLHKEPGPTFSRASALELSPIFGGGLKDPAAAVWGDSTVLSWYGILIDIDDSKATLLAMVLRGPRTICLVVSIGLRPSAGRTLHARIDPTFLGG
jgi:hypothetical protein